MPDRARPAAAPRPRRRERRGSRGHNAPAQEPREACHRARPVQAPRERRKAFPAWAARQGRRTACRKQALRAPRLEWVLQESRASRRWARPVQAPLQRHRAAAEADIPVRRPLVVPSLLVAPQPQLAACAVSQREASGCSRFARRRRRRVLPYASLRRHAKIGCPGASQRRQVPPAVRPAEPSIPPSCLGASSGRPCSCRTAGRAGRGGANACLSCPFCHGRRPFPRRRA